jgi:hypothetical protein
MWALMPNVTLFSFEDPFITLSKKMLANFAFFIVVLYRSDLLQLAKLDAVLQS